MRAGEWIPAPKFNPAEVERLLSEVVDRAYERGRLAAAAARIEWPAAQKIPWWAWWRRREFDEAMSRIEQVQRELARGYVEALNQLRGELELAEKTSHTRGRFLNALGEAGREIAELRAAAEGLRRELGKAETELAGLRRLPK